MRRRTVALVLAAILGCPAAALAGNYLEANDGPGKITGLLPNPMEIGVCFVGDAIASRPDRVNEVASYLRDFDAVGGMRLVVNTTTPCTEPVYNESTARLEYREEIRVMLQWTDVYNAVYPQGYWTVCDPNDPNYAAPNCRIPGVKCTDPNTPPAGGSWAYQPALLADRRGCLYSMKLDDDADSEGRPYKNHTLHEFGHALGLWHEHDSAVFPLTNCRGWSGNKFKPTPRGRPLTVWDHDSVMNYQLICDDSAGNPVRMDGNYGHSGLSELDVLTLQLLYPSATDLVPKYVGRTYLEVYTSTELAFAWAALGVLLDQAIQPKTAGWRSSMPSSIGNGFTVSASDTTFTLWAYDAPPRRWDLVYGYDDWLGRPYTNAHPPGWVQFLWPHEFKPRVATVPAAHAALP